MQGFDTKNYVVDLHLSTESTPPGKPSPLGATCHPRSEITLRADPGVTLARFMVPSLGRRIPVVAQIGIKQIDFSKSLNL